MLHLFKKTYLEIDSFIDGNIDRIIISETHGNPPYSKMEIFYDGILMGYGLTLDDVAGEGKAFSSFLNMLKACYQHNVNANTKVIIYCDKPSLMKILTMWHKLILQNPTSANSFSILRAHFNKQIYMTNASYERANDQDNYEAFGINESEFTACFNNTTLTEQDQDFLNSIRDSLSLELYLSSYYYNGTFKDQLKSVVKLMATRYIKDITKETWTRIVTNIANSNFREKLNFTSSYNFSNYPEAFGDSRLNSLKMVGANLPFYDDSSSIHTLPNISTLTEPQIEEIKSQVLTCYFYSMNDLSSDIPENFGTQYKQKLDLFFNIAKSDIISDVDFEKFVDSTKLVNSVEKFWSLPDQKNINFFFIDEITKLKASNQQALLSGYLLK